METHEAISKTQKVRGGKTSQGKIIADAARIVRASAQAQRRRDERTPQDLRGKKTPTRDQQARIVKNREAQVRAAEVVRTYLRILVEEPSTSARGESAAFRRKIERKRKQGTCTDGYRR